MIFSKDFAQGVGPLPIFNHLVILVGLCDYNVDSPGGIMIDMRVCSRVCQHERSGYVMCDDSRYAGNIITFQ